MKRVLYAGALYDVIFEGNRVLHLRSIRDPKLIIHCPVKSEFLEEYPKEREEE